MEQQVYSNQDANSNGDLFDVGLSIAAVAGAVMLGRSFMKGSKTVEKTASNKIKKDIQKTASKEMKSGSAAVTKGDVQGAKDLEKLNKIRQQEATKRSGDMQKNKLPGAKVDEGEQLDFLDKEDPWNVTKKRNTNMERRMRAEENQLNAPDHFNPSDEFDMYDPQQDIFYNPHKVKKVWEDNHIKQEQVSMFDTMKL